MRTHSFDPAGVNRRKLRALVAQINGTVEFTRATRPDGEPGVPILFITVEDETPGSQVDDLVAQTVAVQDADLTSEERLDSLDLPPRVLAALILLASTTATPGERQAALRIVNAAAVKVRQALEA